MSVSRKKIAVLRKHGDRFKGSSSSDEAYLNIWNDNEDLSERVNSSWEDYSDDDKREYLRWVAIKVSPRYSIPQLVRASYDPKFGTLGRKKISDLIGLIIFEMAGEEAASIQLGKKTGESETLDQRLTPPGKRFRERDAADERYGLEKEDDL